MQGKINCQSTKSHQTYRGKHETEDPDNNYNNFWQMYQAL